MSQRAKQKAYHHGDLRNALMNGALDILETKGIEGLSLREVAREIGVSHTAPYRHFPDKTALLVALAESGFAELKEAFEKALVQAGSHPRQQLLATGIAYVEYAVAHPKQAGLMFGNLTQEASQHPSLMKAGESAFSVIVGVIERGQQAKVFRTGPQLELALAAWSIVHGVSTLFSADRPAFSSIGVTKPREAAQFVGKLLFEGIARK